MSQDRDLSIGLLAETHQQLHDLGRIVGDAGHRSTVSLLVQQASASPLPEVDAWLVRLHGEYDRAQGLLERLETAGIPVIYDETELMDAAAYSERARRIAIKLGQLAGRRDDVRFAHRAREVWVLAASTGGPEAVSEFLQALPCTLDEVAFLYVQHIGNEISATLRRAIGRHSQWAVHSTDEFCVLEEKGLYVVSPRCQIELGGDGSLQPLTAPWNGPYSPSVDQVMAKVARVYGARSGAIIFSGMGDDGRRSCAFMKRFGGRIWAQAPETCAVDSMPASAIASQCVSFIGTPQQLAKKFMAERLPGQTMTQSG